MGAGAFNRHRQTHKRRVAEQKVAQEEFDTRPALVQERKPLADDEFPMEISSKVSRKKLTAPKPLPKLQELPKIPKAKDSPWRRGKR
jgi:hypothetical protein